MSFRLLREVVLGPMLPKHRKTCSHEVLDRFKILTVSSAKEDDLVLEMIENGISVDVETPGRKSTPDAALLLALTRSPRQKDGKTQVEGARIRLALKSKLQQVDALRNQRIEGRLAILLDAWNAMMWSL